MEGFMATVKAEPYAFEFDPQTTALLMIDFQRDFVDPGGFGEALGNDVSLLRRAVPPAERVLKAARKARLFVVHTREGHRPDLADCPPAKRARGRLKTGIGDPGPMGRILVRGEPGHDLVKELYPEPGEPVVDKPGKGSFYATDLDTILKNRGIKQLVCCGVTTEVCVNTTVREANDRGYDCLVLEDCVASYFPEFQEAALKMVKAQGGIFGWVGRSQDFLRALARAVTGRAPKAARRRGEARNRVR
jgi:nicotinamidase-related amidase